MCSSLFEPVAQLSIVLRIVLLENLGRIERELLPLSVDHPAFERQGELGDAGDADHVGVDEGEAGQCDLVASLAAADADDSAVEVTHGG